MNSSLNELKFYSSGRESASWKKTVCAPLFKKIFTVKSNTSATLTVGATGFYEMYLNGTRITKGYLAPYISNPDHSLFFDKYEFNEELNPGENSLCILLGNGVSNAISGEVWEHNKQNIGPALALSFECGETCFTAKDMEWCDSPILFDDLRSGVLCDMTRGISSKLNPAVLSRQPLGKRRFSTCEPIREIRRIKAKSIREGALRNYRMRDGFKGWLYDGDTVMGKSQLSGGYIYDFGENNAGIPCLKIKGRRGQRIEMQFCELSFEGFADYINTDVYPDGCAQRDVYICAGEGIEEFIPPFTYHGFRYCYVTGIEAEQATDGLLEFIVLHNDVKVKSSFRCSDEISNEIFAACRRSDESNLMNIITDCPAREKNGWTGDLAISAEHYMFNLSAENCFADFLASITDCQDKDGKLPLVVPSTRSADDCPIWDSVLAFSAYYAYKYSGRLDILKDNADAIMKNLRYHMSNTDERGLCERGLGDWLPVGLEGGEYNSPLGFCCSAIIMETARCAEEIMKALGNSAGAEFCRTCYDSLRDAVRAEYLVGSTITAGKTEKYKQPLYRPCETSQALALYVGIFNPDEEAEAVERLLAFISENDGAFDCGFLGLRVIFHVLSKYGRSDIAYKMITRPKHPSYANMIYRGETTVCERFSAPGERMGSHNHHFMADVSSWYLGEILGIRVNPDFCDPNEIIIDPDFIPQLDFCEGSYSSKSGEVFVRWERKNNKIILSVKSAGGLKIKYAERLKSNKDVTFS